MANSTLFAQRQNRDSSVDSICTRCYQTVGSAGNAAGLENAEHRHRCDPNGEFNFPVEEPGEEADLLPPPTVNLAFLPGLMFG